MIRAVDPACLVGKELPKSFCSKLCQLSGSLLSVSDMGRTESISEQATSNDMGCLVGVVVARLNLRSFKALAEAVAFDCFEVSTPMGDNRTSPSEDPEGALLEMLISIGIIVPYNRARY